MLLNITENKGYLSLVWTLLNIRSLALGKNKACLGSGMDMPKTSAIGK